MFNRKVAAASIIAVTLLLAGCGSRNEMGVDPGSETGEITEPTLPTTPTDPGAGMPGTMPAQPAPQPEQPVAATVQDKGKAGGFLFWFKKVKATIAVTNPNPKQVSATLTITFSKGGSSVETQTQTIDLGPGENKTLEVKATKTSDDVTVYATNNSSAGASPALGGMPTGSTLPGATPGAGGTGGLPY